MKKSSHRAEAPIFFDGHGRNYYDYLNDEIHLTDRNDFKRMEGYYLTALHELGHSTGHTNRLNRKLGEKSDEAYAREELVAELASVFSSAELGLSLSDREFRNSAAYIQAWKEIIQEHPQTFIDAVFDANRAADYLCNADRHKQKNDTDAMNKTETMSNSLNNKDLSMNVENVQEITKSGDDFVSAKALPLEQIKDNVPEQMRVQSLWCAFKAEKSENGKTNKAMYNCNMKAPLNREPKYLKMAISTEPETWTTYENAKEFAKQHKLDGVAFALSGSGITCIDLDHSIDAQGNVSPFAQKVLKAAGDTYKELSVSGRGIHVFYAGSAPENYLHRNKELDFEVYDCKRFMCITGNAMNATQNQVLPPPQELIELLKDNLAEVMQYAPQTQSLNLTDNGLIEKIRSSKRGAEFDRLWTGEDIKGNRSVSDMALCNMLAFFSGGDADQVERVFRASGMYRPSKGDGYVKRTAEKACATLTKTYDPASYRHSGSRTKGASK